MPFERFTDRSRRLMHAANDEAKRRGDAHIDSSHMLLSLLMERDGVGYAALTRLNITPEAVTSAVHALVPPATQTGWTVGKLPQTPTSRAVVELAIEEARGLGHDYVGTEHLLLGFVRSTQSVAGQALAQLGVTIDAARQAVRDVIESAPPRSEAPPSLLTRVFQWMGIDKTAR